MALGLAGLVAVAIWWIIDVSSLKAAGAIAAGIAIVYWFVNDFILSPMRTEFRDLRERLDRIERRLTRGQ